MKEKENYFNNSSIALTFTLFLRSLNSLFSRRFRMKSLLNFFALILIAHSSWSQQVRLDSVCLNLTEQSISLHQLYSDTHSLIPIPQPNEEKKGVSLKFEAVDSNYFVLTSSWLVNDTVFEPKKSHGRQRELILTGTDHVLGNKLTILNNSDSVIIVSIEDHHLVLIQEAMTPEGEWKPIEFFIHSDCGNSYSGFRIPSKMSYEMSIAKYSGTFETRLRVRALIDQQVYTSNEIHGQVNLEQFVVSEHIKHESHMHDYLFLPYSYIK